MEKTLLITLTGDELADVIQRAVTAGITQALHRFKEETTVPPSLLTRTQLAHVLQVSTHQVSKLVKRGLPSIGIGADRRYRLADVTTWLRSLDEHREESVEEPKNGHRM